MKHTWVARKVRPIIAAGVAGVFLTFMALAWFVFHSGDAVRALAGTGVAALIALVPGLLGRVEYRLTDEGVAKRPVVKKEPEEFELLFTWDELSHLEPTRTGFRYYKKVQATNPLARFLALHVFSGASGEVHVEASDLPEVRIALEQRLSPSLGRGG